MIGRVKLCSWYRCEIFFTPGEVGKGREFSNGVR